MPNENVPKDVPLETRAGVLCCELQRTDENMTFCLDNRRDCPYIELTVLYQKQRHIEGRDGRKGFNLCSLNCNSWLYGVAKYGT